MANPALASGISLSRLFTPAFLCMLLLSCAEPPPEPFQLAGATMGTRYHIAWLPQPGSPTAEQVHLAVEARLESINASMSTYRDDSEISRFNASPVGEWFELSAEFAQVFAMARSVGEASGGAYDVSVGPLVDLWGFGPAMGDTVPSAEAIAAAMEIVGESQLEFDDQALALRKPVAMELDFSSIAKGYAVDVLAEWLLSRGVADFLVEVGGEIRVAGERPSGGPWRIAVEKPDHAGREMVAAVMLSDAAVATSGDYRNFFEVDGVRYSHTIDPRTGAPVRHELVSVTVIEASAAMADAWATALTVLGTEKAMTVAIEQGLAVYLISRSGDELVKSYSPAMAPLLGID